MNGDAILSADTHYRMSKKIAQLTKVIGLLVTKNDDYEYELSYIDSAYQEELKRQSVDLEDRLLQARRSQVGNADSQNNDVTMKTLIRQHEAEKKAAINDFQMFKKRVKEHEQMLAMQSEKRIEAMLDELAELRTNFQLRADQFAQFTQRADQEKAEAIEAIRKSHAAELASLMNKSTERLNQTLADKARSENETKQRLKSEFEQTLETQAKMTEERISNLRAEEELRFQASLQSVRKDMGAEVDRYRLQEGSLRHTLTEVQNKLETTQEALARREKEIHDLQLKHVQEMQESLLVHQKNDEQLQRELQRMKENHAREVEEINVRLLQQSSDRVASLEEQHTNSTIEAQRLHEAKLQQQEKVLKSQMNELFLKLQSEYAEQAKEAAEKLLALEEKSAATEAELRLQMENQRRDMLLTQERLEEEAVIKLQSTTKALTAAEQECENLRGLNRQLDAQCENWRIQMTEAKRNMMKEQETMVKEVEARERQRQQHVAELERNLQVLAGADERALNYEKDMTVLKLQAEDMKREHERELMALRDGQGREAANLKAALDRLRIANDQALQEQKSESRDEMDAMEKRHTELNSALMHKYEDLLARREQEAEAHRLSEKQKLEEEMERRLMQQRGKFIAEREDAINQLKATHQHSIELLQQEIRDFERVVESKSEVIAQKEAEVREMQLSIERLKAGFLRQAQEESKRFIEEGVHKENSLVEIHRREMEDLKMQATVERERQEQQIQQLRERISAMEFQIATREARPQDLERISMLEKEVEEKEYLCRKIMEEMKYFKLELQNREESFNKTFNRAPTVAPQGALPLQKQSSGGQLQSPGVNKPRNPMTRKPGR